MDWTIMYYCLTFLSFEIIVHSEFLVTREKMNFKAAYKVSVIILFKQHGSI